MCAEVRRYIQIVSAWIVSDLISLAVPCISSWLCIGCSLCLRTCLATQSGMSEVSSYLNLTCAAAKSLGSRLEERLCGGQIEDRAVV